MKKILLTIMGVIVFTVFTAAYANQDLDEKIAAFSETCGIIGEYAMHLRQDGSSIKEAEKRINAKFDSLSSENELASILRELALISLPYIYSEPIKKTKKAKERAIKEFSEFLKETCTEILRDMAKDNQ